MDHYQEERKSWLVSGFDGAKTFSKIVGLLAVAALVFFASVYTVESGYVGVLSTFGKYSKEEVPPGIHFKIPLAQSVRMFDIKLQAVHYKGKRDLPDKRGVIYKPMIRVLDSKNLPIGIELTVQYTPKKDMAAEILIAYGPNYFDKLINPIVRDVVRDVIGKYQAEKIAEDRTKIGEELKTKLDEKFAKLPFVLNEVSLRDVILPPIVVKKIEEVQLAKQEEQKLAMVEKQAERRQKIKTIEANTKLIEITTKAKAEAEKKKIEADAKAYQIMKEAEAQAKANKILAESITQDLIQYKKVQKWNGSLPKTYLESQNKGTSTLLPLK